MARKHNYASVVNPNVQENKLKEGMIKNHDGHYVFQLDDFKRLDQFLILGSEGNTYYVTAKELTIDNAKAVERCIKHDGIRAVNRITEISVSGRAPKQEPAIFALAMASLADDLATRKAALDAVGKVCRTGTHLFTFAEYRNTLGKWNRSLRTAISAWYNDKSTESLAYQLVKYRQRNGWTHKDLLRLAHVNPVDEQHDALYKWAVGKGDGDAIELVNVFNEVQRLDPKSKNDVKRVAELVVKHRLPREALPTDFLNSNVVWEALLEDMPMTALIRNLGTMTKNGLLVAGNDAVRKVCTQLADVERLRKARVHPIQMISALKTYAAGHGVRGSSTWTPVQNIVDALDDAFYASFDTVVPTGKRIMLALDVSGSMTCGDIAGVPGLTPAVASAVMAMVTKRVEKGSVVYGFGTRFEPLEISPKQRLDAVVSYIYGRNFGGTDCALPMTTAQKNNWKFDAFCVYTDNDTNSSRSKHPAVALEDYRKSSGIKDAALIVTSMLTYGFSIGDPDDARTLNVVGFDSAAPQVIADFIRNE
jgi:60 kDa SS-A/Ro ribonucleoprotein